jgi:hypothetical protein
MTDESSVLKLVRDSVRATQRAVLPGPPRSETDATVGPQEADLATAYDQSLGKTVQSVGQTTAIVIQDAADMLRNVNTVETTAIGAATAKWIATGSSDPVYETIITKSLEVMTQAAGLYLVIGKNAFAVLSQFQMGSSTPPAPAEGGTRGTR